jgi:hypothetical protein
MAEEGASFPLGGWSGATPGSTGPAPDATSTQFNSTGGTADFDGAGSVGGTASDTSVRLVWDETAESATGNVSAPGCSVSVTGGNLPRNGFSLSNDTGGGTIDAAYSVSGDGVLEIEADETMAGAVDANGLLAAAGSYDASEGRAGLLVMLKRSAPGASPAFSGTYHFAGVHGQVETGGNTRTIFGSGRGTITASAGTISGSAFEHEVVRTIGESQDLAVAPVSFACGSGSATVTVWSDDLPAPQTDTSSSSPSGTFSVDPDGNLTVNAGDVLQGVVGEGGTFALLRDDADDSDGGNRGFMLFVQAPSGLGATPLSGTYRFVSLETEMQSQDEVSISGGTLTFTTFGTVSIGDGEERKVTRQFGGAFGNAALDFSEAPTSGGRAGSSVTTVSIATDTVSTSSSSGTYTVTPDGVVTITISGEDPQIAYVSPDLGTLVVPLEGSGAAGLAIAFREP